MQHTLNVSFWRFVDRNGYKRHLWTGGENGSNYTLVPILRDKITMEVV